MSKIESAQGHAVAVHGDDIDTDRIIPARFLKTITFDGLEDHVFEDDRLEAQAHGKVHPFDDPAHKGAAILLGGANFGCGSSREHAPQAIKRWGIGAVVAVSFAEIFFGNSLMIGLACATVSPEQMADLMALAEAVAFQRLDQRLASALLGHGAAILRTHQSLADELGTVREIVTRLLKRFERAGWIALGRERVDILNAQALRTLASGQNAQ